MAEDLQPNKIPLIFFRTLAGSEPVREWLKQLPEEERQAIGKDLLRAQWRWPGGDPAVPIGNALWEMWADSPTRTDGACAAVPLPRALVALHGFSAFE